MKKIAALILILLLVACGGENQAKKAAEQYMDDVKNGIDSELIGSTEGFIDVFSYEYLQTLDSKEEKDTRRREYSLWESIYKDEPNSEYPTFEDYIDLDLQLIESHNEISDTKYEVIQNDDEALEYWDGESYYNVYEFLYNVEIANELGEKIFKKAEITVEEGLVWDEKKDDYIDGYVISDIYLR